MVIFFRLEGYFCFYIFILGGLEAVKKLIINVGYCWMCFVDVLEKFVEFIELMLDVGKDVGLWFCVIFRLIRKEAIEVGNNLIKNFVDNYFEDVKGKVGVFFKESDFVFIKEIYEYLVNEWFLDCFWIGVIFFLGFFCIVFVGFYEEVVLVFF